MVDELQAERDRIDIEQIRGVLTAMGWIVVAQDLRNERNQITIEKPKTPDRSEEATRQS